MGTKHYFNPDKHLENIKNILLRIQEEDPSLSMHSELLENSDIENFSFPVCLFDENSGKLIYANKKVADIFGYNENELQDFDDSLPTFPGFSDYTMNHDIARSIAIRGIWSGNVKYLDKNAEEFWSKTYISIFETEKSVTIWLVLYGRKSNSQINP